MAKDEIKEVTAFAFAGSLWKTREEAEAKRAIMDLQEWTERNVNVHAFDSADDVSQWLLQNKQALLAHLSKVK